nr:zinc finger, CCHC-type [Tanacetum cinerariifolium]
MATVAMSVVYVLTTPIPEDDGDDPTVEQVRKRNKWDNDDYICRGLILKYSNHTLKHLKEELTLVESGSHLRIKESLRMQDSDKPKNNVAGPLVFNMVEHNNSSRYNDNKGKRKHHDNTKSDPNKKSKVTCWKCGKPGHLKNDCKGGKVGNKANGSGINVSVDGSTNSLKGQNIFNKSFQVYYVTYVSEAYFVQDDDVAWWVDSGATVHVCKDRCWFKAYESLNDGYIHHMGNESTALVHRRDCVDLKFSFEKIVSLFNILHVPNITKNLVSSSVLNNCSYKQVIESNKFVLSKHVALEKVTKEVVQQPEPELRKIKSNVAFWKEIISDEMYSIMGNNTWVLVDLPPGCKPLGCKWIFKRKLKVYRTIKMFKARLVIQSFKQKSGIDYFDTYAPVARISTIRLLIAMASILQSDYSLDGCEDNFLEWIKHESNGIAIPQSHYIENVLKKFNYFDCTPVSTLMDTSEKLMPNNGQAVSQLEYTSNLGTQHWQAIQRVLKYLKKIMDYRLTYTGYPSVLECYTDASLISSTKDNSSTSGWAQEVEILKLKERVKVLEDREGIAATRSEDDAPIKGKSIDEGEAATERISDDTEEMATVLTSIDAVTVLAGGIDDVPTGSGSIPTTGPPATDIPTGSDVVPTASPVFATATVVTPYSRRKGKEVMVESDTLKKQRLQEQIDAQVARELKEQQEREDKRMSKQIARDAEVARIHVEEELQSMIDGLDRNNETLAKYLQEYQQFATELPLERRIELISDLVKYQENYAKIYKFQSQQRKSWTKKQKRDYYMAMANDLVLKIYKIANSPRQQEITQCVNTLEDPNLSFQQVFLLGGGAISYASKKQTCITGSTMESEFVALAAAGKEAEWLKNLLIEISLWSKPIAPISICCDIASTLANAYSQMYNGKSSYLGVRHSMIRELITNEVIYIEFVRSQQNLADHLTNGVKPA